MASLENAEAVFAKINSYGGQQTLRYPPRLIFGQGSEELLKVLPTLQGISGVYTTKTNNIEMLELDAEDLVAVKAWNLRRGNDFIMYRTNRTTEKKISWSDRSCDSPVSDSGAYSLSFPRDTSLRMIGTVAVGVITVNGPAGTTTAFSESEYTKVVAEVQEGAQLLTKLATREGIKLRFLFDPKRVSINTNPDDVQGVFGEDEWRNAAMAQLNYEKGTAGLYRYLNELRTTGVNGIKADWAYIAYFIKYPAHHFAFAQNGGPRLVIQYSNGSWGPDQIHLVFAHETGHIFGAPDEYDPCQTGGSWSHHRLPNNNCEVNNSASITCLMKENADVLCKWTKGHFGWPMS